MIFFTGDTHFGDPRVLRIDRRPFSDMAEHDAVLIRDWNAIVGDDDDVWHLGDFMSAKAGDCSELLASLNGRKHLIVGNNDPETTTSSDGWSSVQHYTELREAGRHLILCHYAFRTWNQMGKGSINLHGHSHGRLKSASRQFDVGVDAQGLRPVSLGDILAGRKRGDHERRTLTVKQKFDRCAFLNVDLDSTGNHRVAGQIAIEHDDLRAGSYSWARRTGSDDVEVVQVSDIFGSHKDYWTVAVMGSEQHHSLPEFSFLIRLIKP